MEVARAAFDASSDFASSCVDAVDDEEEVAARDWAKECKRYI